jgi:hypothetical protein
MYGAGIVPTCAYFQNRDGLGRLGIPTGGMLVFAYFFVCTTSRKRTFLSL